MNTPKFQEVFPHLIGKGGKLRTSKPNANGFVQFVWRQCRFDSGADRCLPVTAYFDLQIWINEQGLDAEVAGKVDERGKEILDAAHGLATECCKKLGLSDLVGAVTWVPLMGLPTS